MHEQRIRKGIKYFRSIKPSEFDFTVWGHLKVFLDLVEDHLFLKPTRINKMNEKEFYKKERDIVEEAKNLFEVGEND